MVNKLREELFAFFCHEQFNNFTLEIKDEKAREKFMQKKLARTRWAMYIFGVLELINIFGVIARLIHS